MVINKILKKNGYYKHKITKKYYKFIDYDEDNCEFDDLSNHDNTVNLIPDEVEYIDVGLDCLSNYVHNYNDNYDYINKKCNKALIELENDIHVGIFTSKLTYKDDMLEDPEYKFNYDTEKKIVEMNNKIKNNKIEQDIIVYRGEYIHPELVKKFILDENNINKMKLYPLPFSTTYSFNYLLKWCNEMGKNVIYKIRVAKGTSLIVFQDKSQYEITLPVGYLKIIQKLRYEDRLFIDCIFITLN